ncbi:MAG: hypothetical protein IIW48_10425 [Clostridia bacterium]|nr:hypothetical protein [Clostridia bacterium]
MDESTNKIISKIIEEICFLEVQLDELRKLPFIEINPKNPRQQRATPASKLYKEMLQQYNGCIKVLLSASGKSETSEESPLRQYLKGLRKNE